MFFCRHDVDGNILLDRHETNKVLMELGEKKNPETRPGIGMISRAEGFILQKQKIRRGDNAKQP